MFRSIIISLTVAISKVILFTSTANKFNILQSTDLRCSKPETTNIFLRESGNDFIFLAKVIGNHHEYGGINGVSGSGREAAVL